MPEHSALQQVLQITAVITRTECVTETVLVIIHFIFYVLNYCQHCEFFFNALIH